MARLVEKVRTIFIDLGNLFGGVFREGGNSTPRHWDPNSLLDGYLKDGNFAFDLLLEVLIQNLSPRQDVQNHVVEEEVRRRELSNRSLASFKPARLNTLIVRRCKIRSNPFLPNSRRRRHSPTVWRQVEPP
jgi:hypothetical protein